MIIKKGKFFSLDKCVQCGNLIGERSRMYNHGICPHCGYNSNGAICDTDKIIIRSVAIYKYWWSFFCTEHYFEDINGKKYNIE